MCACLIATLNNYLKLVEHCIYIISFTDSHLHTSQQFYLFIFLKSLSTSDIYLPKLSVVSVPETSSTGDLLYLSVRDGWTNRVQITASDITDTSSTREEDLIGEITQWCLLCARDECQVYMLTCINLFALALMSVMRVLSTFHSVKSTGNTVLV